ncbi:serine hydrolase [Taibaiella sp. KBW10]|uniref:serine hydrolase domain-containing protein n=1 Tax=Taibaiella sp. KBW10 TaxID=2153357 RepID=UPI000F5AE9A3|nr:serine hydrolase domain-containing protein [Taibaiella sp. KBW10]RQO29769.1 serine hydrolase [Taibaiella sp. KBW10]
MKYLFQLFLLILLMNSGCVSHAQQKDDYTTAIDSLLRQKDPRPFNGVVLVSQQGKVKYAKAYGYANVSRKTPLALDNAFEIMSNSKQITAVLLLQEVDKGRVNLQAPIKQYLPDLAQRWADTVTVAQLLNHTHGIVDLEKPLAFKAGSDFKYGNLSYSLLGKIIAFSSGKSYAEMAANLFKQQKMTHTYCATTGKRPKQVSGHFNTNNTFSVLDNTQINLNSQPADGIVSTAADLALWNHNLHQGKILSRESYALMCTPQVLAQHDVFGSAPIGYGYGIRINDQSSPKYRAHTGLGDGFAALNVYFPEGDVSLIVLENQMNENAAINYYFETAILNILRNSKLNHK